ncbi:TonB-dependent receptor [Pedobacter sp. SYP-B3415]|uniref:SusC/RagA family TonB-linked outer membrane protein n=1 Tax=Pedobacter sp. SYP-B3415 TaxID=2496641 RepID=UPI00101CEEFB|nr:TonB-dependent receptor [Pedobacter sp. SYP-B3415]
MSKRITYLFFFTLLFVCPVSLMAQELAVKGTVTEKSSAMPLPGVTVRVEGTNRAVATDAQGNYSIAVPSAGSRLVFSQTGMLTQSRAVTAAGTIDIVLDSDPKLLNDVVVVGYGTQKKSVVTGSITSVKAADLESMPVNRIEQALQGRTSGITIASSSGQPGSGSTVRVRGLTSFGNNDPLWVVDGVVVDNGGIGYLNQSDIESIEVLKDAASQAIYGARAAAGVILVTTKKGKEGKTQVNYNGFYGTSAPARKLSLLNAEQYAVLRNEASIAAGGAAVFANPASLGQGTDWQDAIFNNDARRQTHEFSVSGGNDRSTFYASFGYLAQDGIVATDISKFNRTNVRLNSEHKLTKWLKLGQNLGYSHDKSIGLGNTNSEFGGPLSSAINLDPITPLVETNPARAGAYDQRSVRNELGFPYGISPIVGQEMTNPLAYIQTRLGNYGWSDNFVGNAYAEAEIIKGLRIRSTLGGKLSVWGGESFTPVFYLNATNISSQTSFSRSNNKGLAYNIENTVSYTRDINKHNISVLLGQGAYLDNRTTGTSVNFFNIPVDNFKDASLNYKVPTAQRSSDGYENPDHTVNSLFARLNYNYAEKYLVTGIIRRDGSSRFGSNNKYGVFPSFSLGWVASQEDFWPQNNIINTLKIRGGYGVVGSDAIGDFAFLSTIGSGRNYTLGTSGSYDIGYSPNAPSNPDLRWEETSQTNIGFEATMFDKLSLSFDWYRKKTSGILQRVQIPGYVGAIDNPFGNVADMQNSGVDLELGYKNRFGAFDFSVNGNVSYLKNEVTFLGNNITFLSGGTGFQASTYPITRTALGEAVNSFYGFQTQGIFQNQAEINNYVGANGAMIQPSAKPGDFRWQDTNGDGKITDLDRVFIGNPTPDWSYGLTFNAGWKGIDLTVFGQGVAGNHIFQGLRRLDVANANYQTKALGRWTGEGSSNSFPRLVNGDPNGNFTNPSDFYLEKGDYFRIKVLQLGYTFPQKISGKLGLNRLRVYGMSENLFTFTKYTGYDPEIGGGVLSIDRGIYPQARSFMFGLNIGF